MAILFDFHPSDGPVRTVTVHTDNNSVHRRLAECADGAVDRAEIVRITDCTPEGADRGEHLFEAGRISNVRWG